MEQTPHIAILPSPGMGHLIPLIEFAKQLVHLHHFHVTCIIPTIGSPPIAMKAILQALPATINHVFLPPLSPEDLPAGTKAASPISLAITHSLSPLSNVLKSLMTSTHLVAFVADAFSVDTFDVAKELNVSPYLFFPTNAMTLSFFLYLPKLDDMVSCEYRDLAEPVQIPGCVPLHGRDLMDPVQHRTSERYKWILHLTKRYPTAKGIVINTFPDLEATAIKALLEEEPGKPQVYPVGPLIQAGSINPDDVSGSACLRWLDDQPRGSVLFVCFGSGGTLSHDQLNELAHGLEMSGQRFLWVVRSPNDESPNAAYFSNESQKDPFNFLPKGFLQRTEGRGLVVPSWAPQAQVLSHGSTGGFLSHCGWNSTLESVVSGVPLIAWPLHSEQKMNALMLTEDIKVALRPKADENGLVGREEIAKVVMGLMEGEAGKRIRERAKFLKEAAAKVVREDGSSTKALSELALKWKNQTV